jgi:hypothetical protein
LGLVWASVSCHATNTQIRAANKEIISVFFIFASLNYRIFLTASC